MPSLWIRCGDADNYNRFGNDLDAAADYLDMLGVTEPLVRCGRYGVSTDGFTGWNYISLFWGDGHAQPKRELTRHELAELNRRLIGFARQEWTP